MTQNGYGLAMETCGSADDPHGFGDGYGVHQWTDGVMAGYGDGIGPGRAVSAVVHNDAHRDSAYERFMRGHA